MADNCARQLSAPLGVPYFAKSVIDVHPKALRAAYLQGPVVVM
jgi:hypothetical protein